MAANLAARPIDFRNPSGFKNGDSEAAIAKTIAEGISITHTIPALHHTHHELLMPSFDHLTKAERESIALYLISLRSEGSQRRSE